MHKIKNVLQFVFLFAVLSISISAQEKPVDKQLKFSADARTWYEIALDHSLNNFQVRNARISVNGNVNEFVSYKMLVDFGARGSSTIKTGAISGKNYVTEVATNFPATLNEAFIAIKPISDLGLTLGQLKVPFGSENIRSTTFLDFSNRALLSANITPELYDAGFTASYDFKESVPVSMAAGVFNGAGMNKNENDRTTNYLVRTVVLPVSGLDVSGNYYGGHLGGLAVQAMDLGAEYITEDFTLNSEFARRQSKVGDINITGNSFFVYGLYNFSFGTGMLKYLTPALRYEVLDPNSSTGNDQIDKITAGLTFTFAKLTAAHFRVNYEKYDYKDGRTNPDKVILEFQVKF